MMTQPSGDWSVFQQIFADHWDEFQRAHPRYQTSYYEGLVAKMLACGNPDKMGYVEYRCLQCGQGTHRVAMSCKSSLCLRCAKVSVDNWVNQVSRVLHEGVIYRHIILTVPAMFRPTFYQNAAVVLSAFMRCGGQCLDDFYSTVRGKALRGGYITVLHTHGRNGQYHPHLHLLATSGGYDAQGARWEHLQFLPYELLRRKWQWHLLTMLRQTLKTEAIHQLVDACFRQYPHGLVTKAWRRNNVPLHFGLHSCSGFSTLFSQYHPLSAECGCLRSKHGVFLSEDVQSRHRTAFASILPESVRKGPPPLCRARSDQTGAWWHPLHREGPRMRSSNRQRRHAGAPATPR